MWAHFFTIYWQIPQKTRRRKVWPLSVQYYFSFWHCKQVLTNFIFFFRMIHIYNNIFLGLTSLEPEKRFSRICKNLCLLLTALFHFIHNNVSPVLMSLTAGQRSSSELQRHLRALSICFFLIVASLSLMIILWQWFTIGNIFISITFLKSTMRMCVT